jgi:hypothetical protein
MVSIQQLDAHGNQIANDTRSVTASVASDNGTPDPSDQEATSVYLSTAFVSGSMTKDPNAATVRFLISPQSAQTYDVRNAWLAAWPGNTTTQSAATSAAGNSTPTGVARAASTSTEELIVVHPSEAVIQGSKLGE